MNEQRTDGWFQERCGLATASRFSDVMARIRNGYAASRKNYITELAIQRLTGVVPETFTTAAMQFGIDYEDTARLTYSLVTGNDVEETGFWKHDILQAGASPDGLVGDSGLVEIKVPNPANHLETMVGKKVPKQYVAQVQGQLWITGREWSDFVSYSPTLPENAQLVIVHVERDEDYIAELENEIKTFLEEVEKQVEFIKNYKG